MTDIEQIRVKIDEGLGKLMNSSDIQGDYVKLDSAMDVLLDVRQFIVALKESVLV